eukprot:g60085.t1
MLTTRKLAAYTTSSLAQFEVFRFDNVLMFNPVTTDVRLLSITVDIQTVIIHASFSALRKAKRSSIITSHSAEMCSKPLDAANVHEVVDKKGASLALSTFHATTWANIATCRLSQCTALSTNRGLKLQSSESGTKGLEDKKASAILSTYSPM